MKQSKSTDDYWYWDRNADDALYASLLLDRGQSAEAEKVLDALLRDTDVSSYFVSTQTKIQLLAALIKDATINAKKGKTQIAIRSDSVIADLSLTPEKTWQKLDSTRAKIGNQIEITRDSTLETFYELLVHDVPADILKMKAIARGNMQVSRLIERIDESR